MSAPVSMLRLLSQFAIIIAVIFLSAGTLRWQMGWMVLGLYFLVLVSSVVVIRIDDEFIENRTRIDERTKGWDKLLAGILRVLSPAGLLMIAGLDHRLKWSPRIPMTVQLLALLLSAIGYVISIWAVSVNRLYSGFVRIEGDTVVQVGPYKYVRHPGYAGSILVHLSIPISLGSIWALMVGILSSMLIFVRTTLEDHALIEGLPGYSKYTERVRYKLFPRIWQLEAGVIRQGCVSRRPNYKHGLQMIH